MSDATAAASERVTFLESLTPFSLPSLRRSTSFFVTSLLVNLAVFSSYNSFQLNWEDSIPASALPLAIVNALPEAVV